MSPSSSDPLPLAKRKEKMTTTKQDPSQTNPEPAGLAFDPDALREKYRKERDRRIRPDGNDQYLEVKGEFATTPTSSPASAVSRSRTRSRWR